MKWQVSIARLSVRELDVEKSETVYRVPLGYFSMVQKQN